MDNPRWEHMLMEKLSPPLRAFILGDAPGLQSAMGERRRLFTCDSQLMTSRQRKELVPSSKIYRSSSTRRAQHQPPLRSSLSTAPGTLTLCEAPKIPDHKRSKCTNVGCSTLIAPFTVSNRDRSGYASATCWNDTARINSGKLGLKQEVNDKSRMPQLPMHQKPEKSGSALSRSEEQYLKEVKQARKGVEKHISDAEQRAWMAEKEAAKERERARKAEIEAAKQREQAKKAKKEATKERQARELEEQARKEANEKARREAEDQAKREAEEQTRREAAEHAKSEAEKQARKELEKQISDAEQRAWIAEEEAAKERERAKRAEKEAAKERERARKAEMEAAKQREQTKKAEKQAATERPARESMEQFEREAKEKARRKEACTPKVLARFRVNTTDTLAFYEAVSKEDMQDVVGLLPENTPLPATERVHYVLARLELNPGKDLNETLQRVVDKEATMTEAVGPAVGCLMYTSGTNMISSCIFDFNDPEDLRLYSVDERMELWGLQIPHITPQLPLKAGDKEAVNDEGKESSGPKITLWTSIDRLNMSLGLLFAACTHALDNGIRCGVCVTRPQLLKRWLQAGVCMKQITSDSRLIYPPTAHDYEYYKASTVAYFLVNELRDGLEKRIF